MPSVPDARIHTAVFSYNRPAHLDNCLTSIRDMYPGADVTVYDDKSSDPGMQAVFDKAGVRVVEGVGGPRRHGGLYDNMQRAYEDAIAAGCDYVLMLQDDLQLVRPFNAAVQGEIAAAFADDPQAAEAEVRFQRQNLTRPKPAKAASPEADDGAARAFVDYQDVGLFHIPRLQALDWSFRVDGAVVISGEMVKSLEASEKGMRRAWPRTPFVMHVPFPRLYRNRMRLPRLSGLRRGIFRYEYMSEADMARMDARPEGATAGWRDYLTVADQSWFDRWLLATKNDAKIMQ